ncbi:MAG: hypothetical protein ACLQUZ_18010 [Rhizomicrobium sp.]
MRSSPDSARPAAHPDRDAGEGYRAPHPLTALFVPLERLLVTGGDGRLAVSPDDQLNAYGCRPFPRPEAHAFASSTASTISERAYARAECARESLIAASLSAGIEEAFDMRLEAMRHELKKVLNISGSSVEIVFAPSGTDSQLHALFAARAVLAGPITNVVVAADQTGSGTVFTAGGRHFSDRTALNTNVERGEAIAGLADGVESVRIGITDDSGELRDPATIDAAVESAVAQAIAHGRRVVLQAMDRSKFGRRAPSRDCLKTICARWPDAVQVVIDACQARLSAKRISAYIERNHIVLLTGSKFFSGPPFSSAMLVPRRVSVTLAQADPPPGFRDYSACSDWPKAWPRLRQQLPRQMNFGMWLRWEAALAEMHAYFAVPPSAREAVLDRFSAAVTVRLAASPSLELLPEQERDASDDLDDEEMGTRTIFPFLLRHQDRLLPRDACTAIYRALNRDMAAGLPSSAGTQDRWLARQLCHIGQPVPLPAANGITTAALRINASARLVSDCWTPDPFATYGNVVNQFEQVSVTLEKIEMLLAQIPHIDDWKGTP